MRPQDQVALTEILEEISSKAEALRVRAQKAQKGEISLDEIMAAERTIHHEIKSLRKLVRLMTVTSEREEFERLKEQVYYELNWQ